MLCVIDACKKMMFEAVVVEAGECSMPTEDDIALIFYSETETMDRSCVGGGHDLRSFFVGWLM